MRILRSILTDLDANILWIAFQGNEFRLSGHFILGLILLVFVAFLHGQSMDGLRRWNIANMQVPRQFDPSPAPIIITTDGCLGLLTWCLYRPLFWLLLILAFDQLVTSGAIILFLLDTLFL